MERPISDELALCDQVRAMCACNQLRRASRQITRMYDAAMAPGGLKVTQLPILVALRAAGDTAITTLAEALALDRTTLTRNLGVLERHGLVRVQEADGDARVRMASLTPEGGRRLSEALARWSDGQVALEAGFDVARLRALYDELAALSAAAHALEHRPDGRLRPPARSSGAVGADRGEGAGRPPTAP